MQKGRGSRGQQADDAQADQSGIERENEAVVVPDAPSSSKTKWRLPMTTFSPSIRLAMSWATI